VVKGGGLPTAGIVTRSAIRPELTSVRVLCRMAGIAIRRRAFVLSVHMTGLAGDRRVHSSQWKCSVIVIESHVRPLGGLMTRPTIRPKLSTVRVLCRMARITILRRAFVLSIHVAGFTCDGRMRAG